MSNPAPLLARFGDYQLDEGNARLSRAGRPIELPPKAFAVLCALVRRPGQLVLKEELLDTVWGHQHVSESVLKTLISQLRNTLEDDARQPRFIETAARRGYRFIAIPGTAQAEPALPPTSRPVPLFTEAAAPHADLIGREAPLDTLRTCLRAALTGKTQVLLLAGEAGIGKSTLIDRFVNAQSGSGVLCCVGQCVEHYGAGEPYMPVLDALNTLCNGDGGPALVDLMRRVAPTWLAQLPWFLGDDDRRQLQREVAGATQDRMLREFGELLGRYTTAQPLLLVLEDMHWSDHATVQLISYMARRRSSAAAMLLASFRPADVIAEDHPLAGMRQELRLHRLCREIDLETFSEVEVSALLCERLGGQDPPEDFVRALHAHTGGLPLFLVNLLDDLIADGSLRRNEQAQWRFPEAQQLTVPDNVIGVIDKQISRLPEDQQQWLGAASVAGVEFLHLPLADVLQAPAELLRRALDLASTRHPWLRAAGLETLPDGRLAARYAFRHALYRHVFYQRLSDSQRMQWHRQIATALRAAQGPRAVEIAAELAMHFERGGEPQAAIEQLRVAAGRALGRSAAHEALRAARHGLSLIAPENAEAQAEAELDLRVLEGVALTRLNVISEPVVAEAFERTRALCDRVADSPARARALQGLWWVNFARGEMVPALALAKRILELARHGHDDGLKLAGCNAMGMTLTMMGELREARPHLEAAVATHARVGDTLPPGMTVQAPGVEALGYLALVCWWMGEPARSRQLADQAVALARQLRHPTSQMVALQLSAALHFFAGDLPQVLKATDQIEEVIRVFGLPGERGGFAWLHGHALVATGRVEEGLAEMRMAEQTCNTTGLRVGLTGYHRHLAEAFVETGRFDEARLAVEQGLKEAAARHEHCHLSSLHRIEAELLLERGDVGAAQQRLRSALDIAAQNGALFNELTALVTALRLPGLATPEQHERLRVALEPFRDEPMPVVAQAQTILAGVAAPGRAQG